MVNRRRKVSGSPTASDPKPDPPGPTAGVQETMPRRKYQDIILGTIASLYLNQDYSDLKIICEDRVFPAHKLVLCPRSKYFQRACCGEFKESRGSIILDCKSSKLVEKILEFLYMGDYTLEDSTTEVEIPRSNSDKGPEPDAWVSHKNQDVMERLPAESNIIHETAVPLSTDTTTKLMGEPLINEKTPVPSEAPLTGTGERVVAIDDSLTDCHPCYFHLRMYGEADYFMIEDLRTKAEENFREAFENCFEKKILLQTIEELYSTRADYRVMRKLATKLIMDNLRDLQGGSNPAIDTNLLKANPNFATELCIATMEKYLSEPASVQKPVFTPVFEYKPIKPFEY